MAIPGGLISIRDPLVGLGLGLVTVSGAVVTVGDCFDAILCGSAAEARPLVGLRPGPITVGCPPGIAGRLLAVEHLMFGLCLVPVPSRRTLIAVGCGLVAIARRSPADTRAPVGLGLGLVSFLRGRFTLLRRAFALGRSQAPSQPAQIKF